MSRTITKAWHNGLWVSAQFTRYCWNFGFYTHSSVFSWKTFGCGFQAFFGPLYLAGGWVNRNG